jgi:hypothetical protein
VSTILWARALLPSRSHECDRRYAVYDQPFVVARTMTFEEETDALVNLPDPRAYRALSRAGVLLAAAGLPAAETLVPFLAADPFRVGIYCALEGGPNDYACAKQMIDTPPEQFATSYKSLRSAKQYFKQLANVPPAELAIFLGIMGPLYVFTHSRLGAFHALDQAEFDLDAARVDAALVCGAFSLEEPLPAMRARRSTPSQVVLSEGAACLVLVRGGIDGVSTERDDDTGDGRAYGIVHPLVVLVRRHESHDDRSGAALAGHQSGPDRAESWRPRHRREHYARR